jgi:hypothetical protein
MTALYAGDPQKAIAEADLFNRQVVKISSKRIMSIPSRDLVALGIKGLKTITLVPPINLQIITRRLKNP